MSYIKLREIPYQLGLKKGDIVQISSDVSLLWKVCVENGEKFDLNAFLDEIISIVGPEGTILIPTFNWDFCSGKTFNYKTSPSQVGLLGEVARRRKDFIRTQHAIYSWAVAGRDAMLLYNNNNKDSFAADSPFGYLDRNNGLTLTIGIQTAYGFTISHYIEEKVGITYRYIKDFTADYIGRDGVRETRTYSMNVRDLDLDVDNRQDLIQVLLDKHNLIKKKEINGVLFSLGHFKDIIPVFEDDVRFNRSRHICNYIGQDE